MKIEGISNCCSTRIDNVEVGECIMYKGALHMKVDIGSLDYEGISEYPNVVINLETNKLNSVIDSAVVQRVKAKIVVE